VYNKLRKTKQNCV